MSRKPISAKTRCFFRKLPQALVSKWLCADLVGRDQLPQQSINAFGKSLNIMDIHLNAKSSALQVYHKFGVVLLGPVVTVFFSSVFVCWAAKYSIAFGRTLTVSVRLALLGRCCSYICFHKNHKCNRKRMAQSEPKQWSCMLESQNSEIEGEIHWFQFCSHVAWRTHPYLKKRLCKAFAAPVGTVQNFSPSDVTWVCVSWNFSVRMKTNLAVWRRENWARHL